MSFHFLSDLEDPCSKGISPCMHENEEVYSEQGLDDARRDSLEYSGKGIW